MADSTRRVIAQRALSGKILSWDVPLAEGTGVRELSGPGGVFGKIAPVTKMLLGSDGKPLIREWSTALYVEEGGRFHAGGLVRRIEETDDGEFVVEAPGFASYPHGIIHEETYRAGLNADALDVYRRFWNYVQSFPDADLGVTVDGINSGVTLETVEEKQIKFKNVTPDMEVVKKPQNPKPGDTVTVKITKPYRLPWWEYRDCGAEMDALLEQASADYTEHHEWNADRTAIQHHIELGVPRLGKKRKGLRFVEGENVIAALPLTIDGDEFAQTVYGVGRGEGRNMRHSKVANRDDRIRRTALFVDKTARKNRLDRLTRREYHRRNDTESFETVLIRDHRNARITSIAPGDDILVEANLDWHGRVRHWVRVTSIEAALDDDTAVLQVARSDQFRS